MTEELQILVPILCALLWRCGGAGYKPFKKAWRRFILPLFLFSVGCAFFPVGKLIWVTLFSMYLFSLGYGEDTSMLGRTIIAFGYGLYTLPFGFNMWTIIVPLVWLGLWWGSNSKYRNQFPWAICELMAGLTIGVLWITLM